MRRLYPCHPGTGSLTLFFLRKKTLPVQPAVIVRPVIAFVQRSDTQTGCPLLEQIQQLLNGCLVRMNIRPCQLQFGVLQRQTRQTDTVQQYRICRYRGLRLIEQSVIGFQQSGSQHAVLVRNRRIINPQRLSAGQQGSLHDFLILIQVRSSRTVITFHEGLHQRIGIQFRIPHQLGYHIGTHFREISSTDAVHLREVHRDMVLLEQLDIRLQDMEIRERRNDIVEVDAIIPYENIVGDTRPAFQSLHKHLPRFIVGKRNLPFTVDVTQHDVHILQRLDMLGRLHGKQVSQCRELLVGETLGQLVQETDEIS